MIAAARGGEVSERPILGWPQAFGEILVNAKPTSDDKTFLAEILSPFALAQSEGIDLNEVLRNDPASSLLEEYVGRVRANIEIALECGNDGIIYVLSGAEPKFCSPMQYGGHYLEHDRALLDEVRDARLNVLVIVGGEGTYIDFVSDLPAHVFAWDVAATQFTVEELRKLRSGALATSESTTEFYWPIESSRLTTEMEKEALGAV